MQRPQLRTLALRTLENPDQADAQTLQAEVQALQRDHNYLDVLLVDTTGPSISVQAALRVRWKVSMNWQQRSRNRRQC